MTRSEGVTVDPGGRFAVTVTGFEDLRTWKVHPDRTLSLAASAERTGNEEIVADIDTARRRALKNDDTP